MDGLLFLQLKKFFAGKQMCFVDIFLLISSFSLTSELMAYYFGMYG
jgi:hypothetical protein